MVSSGWSVADGDLAAVAVALRPSGRVTVRPGGSARGGHTRVFREVFAVWSATWPVHGWAAGAVRLRLHRATAAVSGSSALRVLSS